jgi:uncharacterized protein YmfQ (DUF2313 family)
MITKLFPRGFAWNGKNLLKLKKGMAPEYVRTDDRAEDLINELDPRTTDEMLPDWEELTKANEGCAPVAEGKAERQRRVSEKLTSRGGSSKPYLIRIAAALGVPITIEEFQPFRVGRNRVGDRLNGEDWKNWFWVIAPSYLRKVFRVDKNRVGDRLVEVATDLECEIREKKPANTKVFFKYTA